MRQHAGDFVNDYGYEIPIHVLAEKIGELCQVYTQHLESLGAENVPRKVFSHLLKDQVGESPSKTILND